MRIVILLAPLLALGVASGSACKRACETAENCVRTCECVDATTDTRLDCTMGFRCESVDLVCEAAYDELPCEEVCAQYAAVGDCGFQRCNVDADCVRNLTCPVVNAQGQPTGQFFPCTIPFICDQSRGLCASGSELPKDQQCFLPDIQGQPLCPQPVGVASTGG